MVFVPGAIPGETVLFHPVEERSSYIRGALKEVLSPSEQFHRITPNCSHFLQCGGCQFQHIPYVEQVRIKARLFFDLLRSRRLLKDSATEQVITGEEGQSWGWRARARIRAKYISGERGWISGFYKRGSHRVIQIDHCPVLSEGIGSLLMAITALLDPSPYSGSGRQGSWRRSSFHHARPEGVCDIVLSQGVDGKTALSSAAPMVPDPDKELREALETERILFYQGNHAPKGLFAMADGFFQANIRLNPMLIETVVQMVHDVATNGRVLELFSGAGNFTIPLARTGCNVTAVESVPSAVGMARDNAAANQCLDAVEFICMDANSRGVSGLMEGNGFDLVLLDPPRTGARNGCISIAGSDVPAVVYVSCDPMTLARDLSILKDGGFFLRRAVVADMFPQTAHIEAVVLLQRG